MRCLWFSVASALFFSVCDACMTHLTSNILRLNKSILCVARVSGMLSFEYVNVHGGVAFC